MESNAITRATGYTFAFAWFVALYFVAICVAAITLSASQLQSRLVALSGNDVALSVWQVERIRQDLGNQKRLINDQRTEVDRRYSLMTEAQEGVGWLENEVETLNALASGTASELAPKLKPYASDRIPDDLSTLTNRQLGTLFDTLVAEVKTRVDPDSWKELDRLRVAYKGALQGSSTTQINLDRRRAELVDARNQLSRVEAIIGASEARMKELINPGGKLNAAQEARVYDLIREFDFIERFAMGALYYFSILPSDFLIIVLVITMGVLGSTMQLTYDYYKAGTVNSVGPFILRPMLGAITALVVFILLKAGVLIVTDSAKLGEVAPLNPFFIAFVGIVSGLLSENALEMVRNVGKSWFSQSGNDPTGPLGSRCQTAVVRDTDDRRSFCQDGHC